MSEIRLSIIATAANLKMIWWPKQIFSVWTVCASVDDFVGSLYLLNIDKTSIESDY
ncbi:hypothetical protein [Solitalea lacus]|uniref:hypothetical protein n=1 Tax=Solitalea lacus TaxID=2911172 RepID=UPI001EDA0CD1|nr:hypothetical protein [Solitalea lacus]UKJ06678.1 hypothetical protein L2B55_14210 [Solitalea lacus]